MHTYSILQKRKVTALVIIFLIVSGILGGTYFYKIDNNETKSTTSDKIGNYTLTGRIIMPRLQMILISFMTVKPSRYHMPGTVRSLMEWKST